MGACGVSAEITWSVACKLLRGRAVCVESLKRGQSGQSATARGDDDENGRPVLCKAHGFSGAAAAAAMVLPLPLGLARTGLAGVSEAGRLHVCGSWSRGDQRVIRIGPSRDPPCVLLHCVALRCVARGSNWFSFHVNFINYSNLLGATAAINNPCLKQTLGPMLC